MKKEMLLAIAAFFFMSLSAITAANANTNNREMKIISKDIADVTGEGKKDTIFIKGIPYDEGAAYLKEIFLEIKASNGESYQVKLEGGYEPKLQLVDLNHDGVKDMYVSVPTGGSGGLSNFYLYTLKDFTLKNLTVPEPLVISSQFLNDYKATLTIQETGQTFNFDLKSRAKDYDRLGLYQNGKLNEPTELMIDPYGALKPVLIDGGMQYGLKGIQSVSGAYHADTIAHIESTWLYENGKWTLKGVNVLEINANRE